MIVRIPDLQNLPLARGFLDQGKNRCREKIIKKINLYNAPGHHDLCDGSRSDFSKNPFGYSTKALYSPSSQNTVPLREKYGVCPIHSGTRQVLIYLLCANIFIGSDAGQSDHEKRKVKLRSKKFCKKEVKKNVKDD